MANAFNTLNAAAASFNESVMGSTFSYTPRAGGAATTGLTGVISQPEANWVLEDFARRQTVSLICVTAKYQWETAGKTPGENDTITYGGVTYTIGSVGGLNDTGEQCYSLELSLMT